MTAVENMYFSRFEYFVSKVFNCVNLNWALEKFLASLFICYIFPYGEVGGVVFSISVGLI